MDKNNSQNVNNSLNSNNSQLINHSQEKIFQGQRVFISSSFNQQEQDEYKKIIIDNGGIISVEPGGLYTFHLCRQFSSVSSIFNF